MVTSLYIARYSHDFPLLSRSINENRVFSHDFFMIPMGFLTEHRVSGRCWSAPVQSPPGPRKSSGQWRLEQKQNPVAGPKVGR